MASNDLPTPGTKTGPSTAMERTHLLAPAVVLLSLFIMLVPLPTLLMDFFLTLNLTVSMLVLLISLYVDRPMSFSIFPSMLLLTTVFRLALNLASTKLILLNGSEGTAAAGQVIRSFGEFVVGGNFVVGFVVFIVLIVIQFLVVAKGSERTAEVTARFKLDAMPGKQMSIDADLSAGLIDESEARARRQELNNESDFFGAMDGAIRFTKRDAMASMIIIPINIVAGFLIGVLQLNIPMAEALKTYTILTIGDGLVSAMPSLLVTVAGGIITTRSAARMTLGEDLGQQLSFNPWPLYLGALILFSLALVPGLPKLSFFILSATCFLLGRAAGRRMETRAEEARVAALPVETKPPEEQVDALMKIDLLALEVGYGLIPLVDRSQGGDLVDRIRNIRRQIAVELGVVVPPIHISDNLKLQPREYTILLKDSVVERGEIHPAYMLAINPGGAADKLEGIATRDPSFQLPAVWIRPEQMEQAQLKGFTVVDAATVLSTHLSEVIRRHAAELLTRQETTRLIDRLAQSQPKLIEELIPSQLTLGEVQRVLQHLLREQVPIRDLATVLEALADAIPNGRGVTHLTEHARQALRRTLVGRLADDRGELRVFTLSPDVERVFQDNIRPLGNDLAFIPDPDTARQILEKFHDLFGKNPEMQRSVVLCSSTIRPYVRQFVETYFGQLSLLSYSEIPPNVNVISLGMVS